jgi:hypothetical protein
MNMENVTYTEEFFRMKLATDERWVRRALIRLYERQTATEQSSEQTQNRNMKGFQPCDARWFSRLAEFAIRNPNRTLSEKQLAIARRPWRGQPAIAKYARQLLDIAAAEGKKEKIKNCESCGEQLPTCRCAYKVAFAQWEAEQERRAYSYSAEIGL